MLVKYFTDGILPSYGSSTHEDWEMNDKAAMRKAHKLAKVWGLRIEYERSLTLHFTYGASETYEEREDPLDGNHNACGGYEVFDNIVRLAFDAGCAMLGISEADSESLFYSITSDFLEHMVDHRKHFEGRLLAWMKDNAKYADSATDWRPTEAVPEDYYAG
jgi:hypothetical protein